MRSGNAVLITDYQIKLAETYVSEPQANEWRAARERAQNEARLRAATTTATAAARSPRETDRAVLTDVMEVMRAARTSLDARLAESAARAIKRMREMVR